MMTMSVLQRLVRAVRSRPALDTSFEHYYSQVLHSGSGVEGMPSAREAQRDLAELRQKQSVYPIYR
jgi:hypothetical protein